MNNQVVEPLFNIGMKFTKISSTVLSGKDLTFIEPFFKSEFSLKQGIIELPTIVHISFVRKALELSRVDGFSIILVTLDIFQNPGYFFSFIFALYSFSWMCVL